MKKLLAILAAAFAASPLFAEIYFPNRFVDIGIDASVKADQNLFGASELLVKDIVIDFEEIYKNMGNDGVILNVGEDASLFADVNIKGCGGGLKIGESASGYFNISKDLFKLLAEGNEINEDGTEESTLTKLGASLDMYVSASVPIHVRLGKLRINATPTYFVPIAYLPNPNATATYKLQSDGIMKADAYADVNLYTILDLSENGIGAIVETTDEDGNKTTTFNSQAFQNWQEWAMDALGCIRESGGFDIGIQAEYQLIENKLDIGAYTSIPIVPGHLKNKLSFSAKVHAETTSGLLDYFSEQLGKSEEEKDPPPYKIDDPEFSDFECSEERFSINRPFRLGIEAAFRPIGSWLTLHPMLGIAIRNPFGEDFTLSNIFPEYSLSVDFSLFNVLNTSLRTQYTDKVFMHSLGFSMNLRVLELRLALGTGSSDFMKSFKLSGLKASVGVSMGF